MKHINYIVAAIVAVLFTGLAYAANNNGDLQSTAVRRPQPNQEFVRFATTNGQVSACVWTSSLNTVSGYFISHKLATGAAPTNSVTAATVGKIITITPAGANSAATTLDVLLVE